MKKLFYRVYFRQDEGGGGNGEMISFEEAFGRDPFTGEPTPPADPPADDASDDGDDDETPPADGTPPVAQDGAASDHAPGSDAWRAEMLQRFPNGEGDLWKSYRELETRFSQRPPEAPAAPAAAPEPPAPPPMPLLVGGIPEIKTEEDLYAVAQANPRMAADFALNNRERLSDEQFNLVMNNWFAHSPFEATQAMAAAQAEALREQMSEESRSREEHYVNEIRDRGIAAAVAELPMINDYREELASFVEANPHLNTWVESLTTADQVKSALHSIFYQMAGPKLSQQILEQQVTQAVTQKQRDEAAAAAAAEAEQATSKAKSQRRSTAVAPGGEESADEAIRQLILNPARGR